MASASAGTQRWVHLSLHDDCEAAVVDPKLEDFLILNGGTDPATMKARLPWLGIGQDSVTGYEAMTSGVAIVTTRSNEFFGQCGDRKSVV